MELFVADAFTTRRFSGNQAGVALLGEADFPEEGFMRALAGELKHSETAFVRRTGEGSFHIRYFTPAEEVDLCGHATLAAAHVVLTQLEPGRQQVTFHTCSGPLPVQKRGDRYEMDFPAYTLSPVPVTEAMAAAFGARPTAAYLGRDLLCVFDRAEDVLALKPDMDKLLKQREALNQAVEEAETPDSSQMQTVSKAATGQKTQAIPKAQATQNVQMTESNTQETIEGKRKTRADSEKNR